MKDRCTIIDLPIHILDEAVSRPALNRLVEDGWEVLGSLVVQNEGKPTLRIILRPPPVLAEDKGFSMNTILLGMQLLALIVGVYLLSI